MDQAAPLPVNIGPADVTAAAARIAGRIRPVALAHVDPVAIDTRLSTVADADADAATIGHVGLRPVAHDQPHGAHPDELVLALELLQHTGTFKVAALTALGADVRLVGTEYAHALDASIEHATSTGALLSHADDNPLIAAGAGTLAMEILAADPRIETIVVAVGGGGLYAGTAAAVAGTSVSVVAVEPAGCRALNAAIESGGPVDVPVEPGGATALAALLSGAYVPRPGERVAVVLCGANTDPSDLVIR